MPPTDFNTAIVGYHGTEFSFNSTLQFYCKPGYVKSNGSDERRCSHTKTWIWDPLVCESKTHNTYNHSCHGCSYFLIVHLSFFHFIYTGPWDQDFFNYKRIIKSFCFNIWVIMCLLRHAHLLFNAVYDMPSFSLEKEIDEKLGIL